MIDQAITKETETAPPPVKRLTSQELEKISQQFFEESRAELSAYWKKRFHDRRRLEQPAE